MKSVRLITFAYLFFITSHSAFAAQPQIILPASPTESIVSEYLFHGDKVRATYEDSSWQQSVELWNSAQPDMRPQGKAQKTFHLRYEILDEHNNAIELSSEQTMKFQSLGQQECQFIQESVEQSQKRALTDANANMKILSTELDFQPFNSESPTWAFRANCHLTFKIGF